jgi:hypothetical protein
MIGYEVREVPEQFWKLWIKNKALIATEEPR